MRYLIALLLMVTGCQAASPSFSSFNTNQFSTNNLFISIKDGASVTNIYNTRNSPSTPNSVAVLGDLLWRDVASIATLTNTMQGIEFSHDVSAGDDPDVYFDLFATQDGTFTNYGDFFLTISTNSGQLNLITTAAGTDSGVKLLSGDSSGSIRLEIDGSLTDGFLVASPSGYAGGGTKALFDDGTFKVVGAGTTINPTDNYLPYRSNATTFGNSPWYRISTNRLGFNSTNFFIFNDPFGGNSNLSIGDGSLDEITSGSENTGVGFNVFAEIQNGTGNSGLGVNALAFLISGNQNVAAGDGALASLTGGSRNVAVGGSSLVANQGSDNIGVGFDVNGGGISSAEQNVMIGTKAGYYHNSGDGNIMMGYHSGYFATNSTYNILLGFQSDIINGVTNVVAIGVNAIATNSNEIVIGNTANTKAIFPITSYTGAGTLFLSDDGTYKASGGTTINPSNDYIPVRSGATTFADSGLYRVGVTNIALDSQIIFGPGTTNVLYRSGSNLIYTNGMTGVIAMYFKVVNGAGNELMLGQNAGGVPQVKSSTGSLYLDQTGGSGGLVLNNTQFGPQTAGTLDSGQYATAWATLSLTNEIRWQKDGVATNLLVDSWGIATPEGSKSALKGSTFRNTTNGTFWVKSDGGTSTNWTSVHQGDKAYLAADATSVDTTMASLSISAGVIAGKKYSFKLVIFLSNSTPTDGAKFDFDGGSATATNFRVHGTAFGSALSGSAQSSALATDHTVATVTGDNMMEFNGSFEPSASGTFIPRFAENVDAGGTLTVYLGSNLILTEIP